MAARIIGSHWLAAPLAALLASSCGSASPASPAELPLVLPQTIMILEARALPEQLILAVGERASFMNHDGVTYTIGGGSECPEINVVGVLDSGHTRNTEPFTTARTCDFHVRRNESLLLTGQIIIR